MIKEAKPETPTHGAHGKPPRKRHWWRWILASAAALVVLIIVAGGAFIKLQPTLAPLGLPTAPAGVPVGPLDGTWHVMAGSAAGFRARESFLGIGNDTVGRTSAVTGTVAFSGDQVTAASFRVDLTTIKVNGKPQPQFVTSLGTRLHPAATVILAGPVTLGPALASGATISVMVTGRLSMHGVSRLVTFPVSGRRDGTRLQLTGAIPVAFSAWGIAGPAGYGFLGSLANHGTAEFLLILSQR